MKFRILGFSDLRTLEFPKKAKKLMKRERTHFLSVHMSNKHHWCIQALPDVYPSLGTAR